MSFQLSDMVHAVARLGLASLFCIFIWFSLRQLYRLLRSLREELIYLELTPPSRIDRSLGATTQLFTALHGLRDARSALDRLFGYESGLSCEIVSSRETGIRFVLAVPAAQAEAVEQTVLGYLSEAKIRRVDDYLNASSKQYIFSFRQAAHFALPLMSHDRLEEHDPLGYLTSAMTQLPEREMMVWQLVIHPSDNREARRLQTSILDNADILSMLKGRSVVAGLLRAISRLLFGLADMIGTGYHGSYQQEYQSSRRELEYKKQVAKRLKPVRTLSYFEHELIESIHTKLEQPLFKADIRLFLSGCSKRDARTRKHKVSSLLNLYAVPKYQRLRLSRPVWKLSAAYRRFLFARRFLGFRPSGLFAASEIAGLFHIPHSRNAKTDNVIRSLSKTMPAPVSLKNGSHLDVLLGENQHHGAVTAIGLTIAERERHVYIIGGTGNGKTTMLTYAIEQDMRNGKGIAILDPHGDLAETILRHVPEERIKDVIYLNPDDLTHPIGINLLELPAGLTGDDLLREKDLVTEATISVMRKIFSDDDSGGHRIEYILRNTIQTALTLEQPTLFTLFDLLNDTKYRKAVVKNLEDKDLKNFWKNELGKAGDFQKVKMSAGITAKIGRFLFSASAKRILEQPTSTVDFDDILDSGKILICNFSKGLLGEDTSTLFGTTVLAKLQTAALRRARQRQGQRRAFFLYVDEFQNFATMSFVQMLSEARKYQLFLTMAEQSTAQQDQQRLVDIILANVGTVICFRSGSPADERLILPLFSPYLEPGEIANLPSFQFYMRIAAVEALEPLSGVTKLLEDSGSAERAMAVIQSSRQQYGRTRQAVSENIEVADPPKPKLKKRTVAGLAEPI